jgi:hypothetical protein
MSEPFSVEARESTSQPSLAPRAPVGGLANKSASPSQLSNERGAMQRRAKAAFPAARRARLTVTPSRDVAQARLRIRWKGANTSQTVWKGATQRNRNIVVGIPVPAGNKIVAAQVELQSAAKRGASLDWKTTQNQTITLSLP